MTNDPICEYCLYYVAKEACATVLLIPFSLTHVFRSVTVFHNPCNLHSTNIIF